MRRLLLVFLMFVLPLQWAWASAASVCAHEELSTGAHFGHHEHDHQKAAHAADPTDGGESGSLSTHPDCGVCHGTTSGVVPATEVVPPVWSGHAYFAPYASAVPDRFVETLLRPPLTIVS